MSALANQALATVAAPFICAIRVRSTEIPFSVSGVNNSSVATADNHVTKLRTCVSPYPFICRSLVRLSQPIGAVGDAVARRYRRLSLYAQ